jgi:xanthine/uracil/vitamin C permease (AzgA family)
MFRVLLGGLGLVGAFVSMGFALLICVASQEKRSTRIEWGILLGVVFVSSVMCLLLAVRQDKQRR